MKISKLMRLIKSSRQIYSSCRMNIGAEVGHHHPLVVQCGCVRVMQKSFFLAQPLSKYLLAFDSG
jgi:hypothetical protein